MIVLIYIHLLINQPQSYNYYLNIYLYPSKVFLLSSQIIYKFAHFISNLFIKFSNHYLSVHKKGFNIFKRMQSQSNFLYLDDHFQSLKDYLTDENNFLIHKMSFNNFIIKQQHDMITLLIQRSFHSYNKMKGIIQKLYQSILTYNPQDQLINFARAQLEEENRNWSQLENNINMRKLTLNHKRLKINKMGKVKSKIKRLQKSNLQDDQFNLINLQTNINKNEKKIKQMEQAEIHHIKLRMQFDRIKQFINDHLSSMLEYKDNQEINKKLILNIYIKWNRQQGHNCLIEQTGKIQMQLTNQLKILFPKLISTRKVFKGIQFKIDNKIQNQFNYTDRININNNIEIDQNLLIDSDYNIKINYKIDQ